MNRSMVYTLLFFGYFFAIAGLACIAVSLATDHWIEYTVDRSILPGTGGRDWDNEYNAFTRNRGIFRTCYEDTTDALWLEDPLSFGITVVDSTCIQDEGLDIDSSDTDRDNWGTDYETRNHLLRLHVALFVLALLFILVACIVSIWGCWREYSRFLLAAGGFILVAGIFTLGGMGTFHGYWDLELNNINHHPFPKNFLGDTILNAATEWKYGYSYILGWIGGGVAVLACIFLFWAGWIIRQEKYNQVYVSQSIEKVPPMPQPIFVQEPPQPQVIVQESAPRTIIQKVPVPVPVIHEKPVPIPVERPIPVPVMPPRPPAYEPMPPHMMGPPPMMQPPGMLPMPPMQPMQPPAMMPGQPMPIVPMQEPLYYTNKGMRKANSMPYLGPPPMVSMDRVRKSRSRSRHRPRHRHHHRH